MCGNGKLVLRMHQQQHHNPGLRTRAPAPTDRHAHITQNCSAGGGGERLNYAGLTCVFCLPQQPSEAQEWLRAPANMENINLSVYEPQGRRVAVVRLWCGFCALCQGTEFFRPHRVICFASKWEFAAFSVQRKSFKREERARLLRKSRLPHSTSTSFNGAENSCI